MDTNSKLRISLVQSDIIWENVAENLNRYSAKFEDIVGKTDIVVLPEMFATGFSMNSELISQTCDGVICNWLKETALKYQFVIAAGVAVTEQQNGENTFYNRFVWTEPDGSQLFYDKRHLFRIAGENTHYSAGESQLIINYLGWRIRPFVCYDLRFPVWSRNVVTDLDGANDFQYDCAIYIANWPASRSLHWSTLLQARAIENQCFIIGVNRVGTDAKGYTYSGDTVAISPQGVSLSHIEPFTESVETIDIDKDELVKYRTRFPFIMDADDFILS